MNSNSRLLRLTENKGGNSNKSYVMHLYGDEVHGSLAGVLKEVSH